MNPVRKAYIGNFEPPQIIEVVQYLGKRRIKIEDGYVYFEYKNSDDFFFESYNIIVDLL